MPQGRVVLKRISESKKMPLLKTDGARLLYTWLIPHVDINGCYKADPQIVKGKVFTKLRKSTKVIASYLQDLSDVGSIVLYSVDGEDYLCIPDFTTNQPRLNPDREAKPTIPPPTPEQLQTNSRVTPPKVKESKGKSEREGKDKVLHLNFVFLTEEEHSKLVERFGKTRTASLIEDLNIGLGKKDYKYKSHYYAILSWARKEEKENPPTPQISTTERTTQNRKKIREDYESYLRAKNTQALKDLRKDKGAVTQIANWLIDEILAERRGTE